MKKRVYNFSAGPAALPEEVLSQCARDMSCYKDSGMSVMEMSHRTKDFKDIIESAEEDLRSLLNIPENYRVLFLQGGGYTQFAMVPANLMKTGAADYVITGLWSKRAAAEAGIYGKVRIAASSEDKNFSYIPDLSNLSVGEDSDYVYICQNNTIYGTTVKRLPNTKGKPLVSDVSSMFLSEPLDISKYGLLFAGAQKNAGPAGVTVVIIREDLISDEVFPYTPTMLRYKTHANAKSLFNTPPCWNIYVCGLVFKWLKSIGGLSEIKKRNEEKAKILYDFLDASHMFKGTVRKEDRSLMNVTFKTGDANLDKKFIEEAELSGFRNIKGYRTIGGMRASLYNAVPVNAVKDLTSFMEKFEKDNG